MAGPTTNKDYIWCAPCYKNYHVSSPSCPNCSPNACEIEFVAACVGLTPEQAKQTKRYVHNPRNGKKITGYLIKSCTECGEDFIRPNGWRMVVTCPDCSSVTKEYIKAARLFTARLLDGVDIPATCNKCGKCSEYLQAHHIVPLVKGGGAGLHNIEFLCNQCHYRAHSKEAIKGD